MSSLVWQVELAFFILSSSCILLSRKYPARCYLYTAFFSTSIFTMPVTPNVQALRFLDKRPFSTRSRNERRSRAQPSPPQLSTPPPPPTAVQPEQTVHVVDCGSNDLNMQCQGSLSEPPQSRLNRLRRKTSKWFTNRRPAKGMSIVLALLLAFVSSSLNLER